MPRIARGLRGGGVAHVLSRGNAKATVFHSAYEYSDFIELLDEARARCQVDLLAFCIMPNHFHLVVRVDDASDLSAMMQWWLTTHVRRHHQRHQSNGTGHIWQGRFKSFPVQEDGHLLTVLRYVLRNPLKANLVDDATKWPWSSLHYRTMLTRWPVRPPTELDDWLHTPTESGSDEEVRHAIRRSSPLGDAAWQQHAARAWGLESSLGDFGRPRNRLAHENEACPLF